MTAILESMDNSNASSQVQSLLPTWAEELRKVFRASTLSQFLLYGNIYDLVGFRESAEAPQKFLPLRDFLSTVLFGKFEVVLYYSRGAGLKFLRGQDRLEKFQQVRSEWGLVPTSGTKLPKEAVVALEFIDLFLRWAKETQIRVAVVLDFVQFLVPQSDPSQMSDRSVETLIRLQDWARDEELLKAHHATVLLTENLGNLSRSLVESVNCHKLQLSLPAAPEIREYLTALSKEFEGLEAASELPLDTLAVGLVGLTKINIRHMVALALRNQERINASYVSKLKKELIEKECQGLLEFIDSRRKLDDVAGLDAVKDWLRRDCQLLKQGKLQAMPMGYLLTGRIGTGKTWLANCLAGEMGIPFVVLKNFRDKWMGATEANLEKIFTVLRALGQVLVFVDEADQMTGKRSGGDDGGISGRVYGMLAKEMSETANRGKILWVFATSRPDLVEVDLKRPGRLDVHIPLFPPQSQHEYQVLFTSLARKVGLKLTVEDLPALPDNLELGGNEIEAVLVRVQRLLACEDETEVKAALAKALSEYRPLPHRAKLEFMDLQAVKECTDTTFLPEKFLNLTPTQVEQRLQQLEREL